MSTISYHHLKKIKHIIQGSIQGDKKAQRVLYDQYQKLWFTISMRYGRNQMQAEDIFQEGVITVFNNLAQFDDRKGEFASWSIKVIVNAALRYLKKNSWTNELCDIDEANSLVEPDEQVVNQFGAKQLTELIQQLPIGYRMVFNMYVMEGFTHREIASELGIQEGTSKSQLSKARKLLRKKLETQLKKSSDV